MSRSSEFQSTSRNPATKFIEWKSDDKCFSFYDKDKGENVLIELPFKFLALKEMHTVKGFHDKSNSGIWSNQVANISKEELVVRAFKGGILAKGLYKDIKENVNNAGGHYSKSIYAMTEAGDLINIQLKGSGVQAWGEFTQKTSKRLSDEWVTVTGANELKKGRINYSTPIFEFSKSLTAEQSKQADRVYDELIDYLNNKDNTSDRVDDIQDDEEFKILSDDDIGF